MCISMCTCTAKCQNTFKNIDCFNIDCFVLTRNSLLYDLAQCTPNYFSLYHRSMHLLCHFLEILSWHLKNVLCVSSARVQEMCNKALCVFIVSHLQIK